MRLSRSATGSFFRISVRKTEADAPDSLNVLVKPPNSAGASWRLPQAAYSFASTESVGEASISPNIFLRVRRLQHGAVAAFPFADVAGEADLSEGEGGVALQAFDIVAARRLCAGRGRDGQAAIVMTH